VSVPAGYDKENHGHRCYAGECQRRCYATQVRQQMQRCFTAPSCAKMPPPNKDVEPSLFCEICHIHASSPGDGTPQRATPRGALRKVIKPRQQNVMMRCAARSSSRAAVRESAARDNDAVRVDDAAQPPFFVPLLSIVIRKRKDGA